ncbi:hypothetical protein KP509_20G067300 [Ceratopteris richardii]|uniref:Uncharacterized protein n=1 Tax=Ceratopteris richardii TaxID=49495 RepID=A0A8T2SJM4_CERRI|nr:hypothetical protein KP509_20G067300 [Ceratopteris richardii]
MRNEVHVAYLRKQLEDVYMAQNESVDVYVTRIKDLKEQLENIDENVFERAIEIFATTLHLVVNGNPNMYAFDEVVSLHLQEEQCREKQVWFSCRFIKIKASIFLFHSFL